MNDGRISISVDEAKEIYDEKDVTVLDVVDTGTFEKIPYKVKDAVRIAPEDFKEEYSKLPEIKTCVCSGLLVSFESNYQYIN